MTLDDADVHEPHCSKCLECEWCLGDAPCEESEDGKHDFRWAGE